mmetsp:Transcript_12010/g.48373  ORF Transcript_12010/g.48373 Transcript_12010/m.48373 type:complete len:358 (-) Transcript_12010:133-1206(-)|eukprot:CAMPEP_0114611620 /NCGR_PEP_ID=MMETSP0168-20121206/4211_1 /TAXON_ID=95228 ORGANISM="Vannella sp., Strain DIVA3 517/6/12" /NCGR_SAMPLE_ID=MMETSP0168 /ASSEMBLY_ACC=CAM_ASM_000044 /LENGTH=357 /DNA_ID=CAMNT_0001822601 /DNA_START=275 /DNA_END=1348 /DNA_ORIENTATION=+
MGCIDSKNNPYAGSKDEKEASRKIDEMIRKDRKDLEHEVKLLLLGAGESGKSTITKQMKIIHLKGFSKEERLSYRDIIHSNVIMAMRAIVSAADKLGVNNITAENKEKAALFTTNEILFEQKVTPEITEAVKALWKDPGILELYGRANEYQLIDSAAYFFENIDRIVEEDYVPTKDDLLRARARTTGITEIAFHCRGVHWRMVDVGGQRNERKKWIHCFQDVTALIFCVAMSEYDLKLYEDERVNRMHESVTLFEEICNCQWFNDTSVIMFLNKRDLFQEKIKKVDLKVCFDDYAGGKNYDNAVDYLKQKFVKLNRNQHKVIYVHVTCATDTDNIRFVFNAVKDIIVRESMQKSDLL